MKRITVELYPLPDNFVLGTPVILNGLQESSTCSLPLTAKGSIIEMKANSLVFDLDLYLSDMKDQRFNRFSLIGLGAIDETPFLTPGTYLSNCLNYIKKLFLREMTLSVPQEGESEEMNFTLKIYDSLNSTGELREVEGISLGGFKYTANLKFKQETTEVLDKEKTQLRLNPSRADIITE